jgi:hypothetical protein
LKAAYYLGSKGLAGVYLSHNNAGDLQETHVSGSRFGRYTENASIIPTYNTIKRWETSIIQ